MPQRQVAPLEADGEHRQRAAVEGSRKGPCLRHGGIETRRGQSAETPQRYERAVDRKAHADVGARDAKCRHESGERRSNLSAVIVHGEGQFETVIRLAHGEPLLEGRSEQMPRTIGERFASEAGQSFWRTEPPTCPPDEKNAGDRRATEIFARH